MRKYYSSFYFQQRLNFLQKFEGNLATVGTENKFRDLCNESPSLFTNCVLNCVHRDRDIARGIRVFTWSSGESRNILQFRSKIVENERKIFLSTILPTRKKEKSNVRSDNFTMFTTRTLQLENTDPLLSPPLLPSPFLYTYPRGGRRKVNL